MITLITGYCNQCGDCCKLPVTNHVLDASGYCKHLRWDDNVAICEFREGVTEPAEDYRYWLRACVPFPRNLSDLRSIDGDSCSYRWVTRVG